MLEARFDPKEIVRAREQFAEFSEQAKIELGESIVETVNDIMTKHVLPDGSGWIRWYLRSMVWVKDHGDKTWDLQVLEDIDVEEIPEGRSLLYLHGGTGSMPVFFAESSPWPLSELPWVKGGYPMSARVIPVSAEEYDHHTDRTKKLKAQARDAIRKHGMETSPDGVSFKGSVKVDVEFLIKRIEHGLGGFDRQPHEVRIKQAIQAAIMRSTR